jgi:hypothetical protein
MLPLRTLAARRGLVCLVVAAAWSLAGCSGSSVGGSGTPKKDGPTAAGSDGGFPAAPLSDFMTDGTGLRIELRTSPFQPPVQGPAFAQLRITDATTGDPVDGLIIKVTPYMPVMQHRGSALVPVVEPQGDGVYLVDHVAFAMGGKAEFKLEITGTRTASVVSPTFDVPE